jgi:hypothetical protein
MPVHGKKTFVAFDSAAGTLTTLSAFFKEASAAKSIDTAETSTFGSTAKTFVLGMNDETVDISGNFDKALHDHMTALIIALDNGTLETCTVVVGPSGNKPGAVRTARECLVKSYNWSASTGDLVSASISFQRTGPNDDGAFAADGLAKA